MYKIYKKTFTNIFIFNLPNGLTEIELLDENSLLFFQDSRLYISNLINNRTFITNI